MAEVPATTRDAEDARGRARGRGFIRKYVFSTDHKVIGLQYVFLAMFAVFVGMLLSLLMRVRLTWPDAPVPGLSALFGSAAAPSGVMTPEAYLALLTIHGTLMVFFVLTVAPQAGFGNYLLPLQTGAREMAFPRLNMLSFWLTALALCALLASFFVEGGPPTAGWTNYAPLTAVGHQLGVPGLAAGENLWILSIGLFCFAALLTSINFITTLLCLRAPGMSLMRLPLTCWAWLTTSVLSLLAYPVLLVAAVLLLLDRVAGTSFFVPAGLSGGEGLLTTQGGGSPILWQHLFWFFGHPEVYISIMPGMGVVSHVLATFARKPVFGYRAMVFAFFAIGLLGFFVWGHHMFTSGISPFAGLAFSALTLSVGAPSAVKTFNWLGTLWGGRIRFTTPMLFAIGFVSVFVAGGLTGLVLGQAALDVPLHDTYFVLGHLHLVMGVAAVFGIFAATYFWFPKMFGRVMSERLGRAHFWLTFVGVYAVFVPMLLMGLGGMPRRYAQFTEHKFLEPLRPLVVFVTAAALVTAAAQLIFWYNFFRSMFKGERAGDNPWEATTLEWTMASPPPRENFASGAPVVLRGAYEFSVPGAARDFVTQTEAQEAGS